MVSKKFGHRQILLYRKKFWIWTAIATAEVLNWCPVLPHLDTCMIYSVQSASLNYREVDAEQGSIFTWHNRMRHHTINVADPESFTLITGILDQYISFFRSNKINICCDEPFDLGKGKSAGLIGKTTYGELYISYVNKLVNHLQSKGKEVMIWGDVLQKKHEIIGKLNNKVTCLNWYYDYGAEEENFKIFEDNGFKQ
jgi:N-acetyl-beta-hexosaminidase